MGLLPNKRPPSAQHHNNLSVGSLALGAWVLRHCRARPVCRPTCAGGPPRLGLVVFVVCFRFFFLFVPRECWLFRLPACCVRARHHGYMSCGPESCHVMSEATRQVAHRLTMVDGEGSSPRTRLHRAVIATAPVIHGRLRQR